MILISVRQSIPRLIADRCAFNKRCSSSLGSSGLRHLSKLEPRSHAAASEIAPENGVARRKRSRSAVSPVFMGCRPIWGMADPEAEGSRDGGH